MHHHPVIGRAAGRLCRQSTVAWEPASRAESVSDVSDSGYKCASAAIKLPGPRDRAGSSPKSSMFAGKQQSGAFQRRGEVVRGGGSAWLHRELSSQAPPLDTNNDIPNIEHPFCWESPLLCRPSPAHCCRLGGPTRQCLHLTAPSTRPRVNSGSCLDPEEALGVGSAGGPAPRRTRLLVQESGASGLFAPGLRPQKSILNVALPWGAAAPQPPRRIRVHPASLFKSQVHPASFLRPLPPCPSPGAGRAD